MSEIISWIAAESDGPEPPAPLPPGGPLGEKTKSPEDQDFSPRKDSAQHFPQNPPQPLPLHQFPATVETPAGASEAAAGPTDEGEDWASDPLFNETALESDVYEQQRRRRVYRGRTAAMLHRYMRYALETGRIPSILGGEFFRSRVTSYSVTTFEDRAIFVHDMEKCLNRLDELSRQVLARVVLQGHDRDEAARLFGCTPRTLRRFLSEALDRMADILLGVGLLETLPVAAPPPKNPPSEAPEAPVEKTCQGGEATDFLLSDCEDGK
ncbi:MAG: sigma-70 region 4 domain-containing protein [Candidatus Sulfotelmatobacter sp.]